MSNKEDSLGDDVTGSDHVPNEDLRREVSLGGVSTASDAGSSVSDLDAVVDDIGDLGQTVDLTERYEFEKELGHGGMGRVWKAFDRRLKRFVAIKRLNSEISSNRKALQRFLTEAQSIASLNHFNIVQIYDFGRDVHGPFLILELVEGTTLAEMLKSGPLDIERAARLAGQMCDALALAHGRRVIHRDVKPANMLITNDGQLKLTDFGLARQDQSDTSDRTKTGVVLGTVDFMSPEQRVDASSVDARSDLWSLGATLYQMLTGRSPRIIRLDEVPEVLRTVVGRSLEDDPEYRYQSALEFDHALRDALKALTQGNRHHSILGEGQCIECGIYNDTAGNYCKACGARLLVDCLQCKDSLRIWERFCTGCGENQQDLLEQKREALNAVRDQTEELRKSYQYEDALKIAQQAQLNDPRLQDAVAWITEFVAEVETESTQQVARRTEVLAEARQFAEEYRYADAVRVLQTVPNGLRDDAVTNLLTQCQQWESEREELREEISDAVKSRQLAGLLSKARRYLELRPNNPSATVLCERLEKRQKKGEAQRDALLMNARKHWQEFRDEEVMNIVACIPAEFHDDEIHELAANAQNRLERAQDFGRQIEEIGKRRLDSKDIKTIDAYLKLRPFDNSANELRDKLRSRQRTRRFLALTGFGSLLLIVAAAGSKLFPEAERQTGQQRGTVAIVFEGDDNFEKKHSEINEVDSNAGDPVTDVAAGSHATKRSVHNGSPIEMATFSPDGSRIATAGWDGKVRIWATKTLELEKELIGHEREVTGCLFVTDSQVLSTSRDGTARLWDLESHTQLKVISFSRGVVRLSSSMADDRFFVGLANGGVEYASLSDARGTPHAIWNSNMYTTNLDLDETGSFLLYASLEGRVAIWDMGRKIVTKHFKPGVKAQRALISPDGRTIAIGGDDGTVMLYDFNSWELIWQGDCHQHTIRSLTFSPDGKQLFAGSTDWSLSAWDAKTGQHLSRHWPGDGWITTIQFSPDESEVLISQAGQGETLHVWPSSILAEHQMPEAEKIGQTSLSTLPPSDASEGSVTAEASSINQIPLLLNLNELNTPYTDAYPWLSLDGLTIFFTREGIEGKESEIWWATRPDSNLKFENVRRHSNGRHPTLTGDLREMIFLRNNSLHSASLSLSGIVNTSTPIDALGIVGTPKGPALSANGQQLLFSQLQSGSSRFSLLNRSTRGGQWGTVTPLPVEFDEKETTAIQWPLLSEDGLTLLFCRAKNQYETKMTEFVVSTRSTINVPFRDVRPLLVNGQTLCGRAPRYVAATRELFYCAVSTVESNNWDLWVVRNFDLNSESVASGELTKAESQTRIQNKASVSPFGTMPATTHKEVSQTFQRTTTPLAEITSPNSDDVAVFSRLRKSVHLAWRYDPKTPADMRWMYCDASEIVKQAAKPDWQSKGLIGFGLVNRDDNDMISLWRDNSGGRQKLFLNPPKKLDTKRHGLLAWVWKTSKPGMIRVFGMEDGAGNMQLATSIDQRDRLSNKFSWKVRFVFFMYPDSTGSVETQ